MAPAGSVGLKRVIGFSILLLAVGLALGGLAFTPGSHPAAIPKHSPVARLVPNANSTPQLTVTGTAPGAISLKWPASTDLLFSNYDVELSTAGSTGPWVSLTTLSSAASTTFYWDGLLPGQTYWWVVLYNGTLSTTVSSVVQSTQPQVAALTATLAGPTSVLLGWTNAAQYGGNVRFVSYSVMQSTGSGPAVAIANLSSVTPRSFVATSLATATSYQYWVQTTDGCAGAANCGSELRPSTSNSNSASSTTPGALGASVSASSTNVAAGTPDNFTCHPSGGLAPYHYTWSFGDGTSARGRSVSHIFYVAGSYTVTCTVSDLLGTTANGSLSVTAYSASGGGGGTGTGNGSGNGSGTGSGNGTTPNGTGSPGTGHPGKPGSGHVPVTTPSSSAPATKHIDPLLIGLLAAVVLACAVLLLLLTLGRRKVARRGAATPPPGASTVADPPPTAGPEPNADAASSARPAAPPVSPSLPPPGNPPGPAARTSGDGLDMDRMMDDLESAVAQARKRGQSPTRWW